MLLFCCTLKKKSFEIGFCIQFWFFVRVWQPAFVRRFFSINDFSSRAHNLRKFCVYTIPPTLALIISIENQYLSPSSYFIEGISPGFFSVFLYVFSCLNETFPLKKCSNALTQKIRWVFVTLFIWVKEMFH